MSATGRVDRAAVTTPKREMDIELVVQWTYRDQMADVARTGMGVSAAVGKAEKLLDLFGGIVNRSAYHNTAVHEDAYRVHETVERLPLEIRVPIIRHGRLATRPDWMPGAAPRPMPLRDFDGRPTVLEADPEANRRGKIKWCPVVYLPSAESIARARDEYLVWWGSLADLCERLETRGLTTIKPLPPSAPNIPWLTRAPKT